MNDKIQTTILLTTIIVVLSSMIIFNLDNVDSTVEETNQTTVGDYVYQYVDSEIPYAEIIDYKGEGGTITIPSSVTIDNKEYIIDGIGEGAFSHKGISGSITIPKSIKNIGVGAFWYNEITSITVNIKDLTLGTQFHYNLITSIIFTEYADGNSPTLYNNGYQYDIYSNQEFTEEWTSCEKSGNTQYIKWTPNRYLVDYEEEKFRHSSNVIHYYTVGEENNISIVKPEKTGFTFVGWKIDGREGTYSKIPSDCYDTITLSAEWKIVEKDYSVTFDKTVTVKSNEVAISGTVTAGTEITISPTIEPGENEVVVISINGEVKELTENNQLMMNVYTDLEISARSVPIYQVTLQIDGDSKKLTVPEGATISWPVIEPYNGKIVTGYYTTDDVIWNSDKVVTSDIVLYAIWMGYETVDYNINDMIVEIDGSFVYPHSVVIGDEGTVPIII